MRGRVPTIADRLGWPAAVAPRKRSWRRCEFERRQGSSSARHVAPQPSSNSACAHSQESLSWWHTYTFPFAKLRGKMRLRGGLPLAPSNSVRPLTGMIHGRRDRTGAPPHSLVHTAIYAGMSRTTSVNLPELIS